MVTRENLLARALPEAVPPIFSSAKFVTFSAQFPSTIRVPKDVRGVDFSASQSGYRRRTFLIPHPIAQFYVADFLEKRWPEVKQFIDQSPYSLSKHEVAPADSARSIAFTSFNELHSVLHKRLGHFPFIARSDIRRFYPRYIPIRLAGRFMAKPLRKLDRRANSPEVFFNQSDLAIRRGQDGQTIGIPIGPDS